MGAGKIEYLEKRRELLDQAIEREIVREAERARFGKNSDYADGAVIVFDRTFSPGGRTYSYAAVKGSGVWFVTGRSQNGYRISWDDFVDEFLMEADTVGFVSEITEM
jgi:hypothetical protein